MAGNEAEPAKKEAAEKPKRVTPAKALAKPLPQMMEEDVIPSLRATLESQEDISGLELSFSDNRVSTTVRSKSKWDHKNLVLEAFQQIWLSSCFNLDVHYALAVQI